MIEFPVRDAPVAIAACPGTGNLLVASNNVMVIYKYVVQETASRNKYIDFEECIHIFQSLIPREVGHAVVHVLYVNNYDAWWLSSEG